MENQTQVRRLAEAMGLDADRTRIIQDDQWALNLMEGMILVDLHIGRWGGRAALVPEDLGIVFSRDAKERKAQERLFQLGHKYLLPETILKRLTSLENMGRLNVVRCSIKTPGGYAMTGAGWERFKARNEELKAEYFSIRDEILDGWDLILERQLADFATMAEDAYRRLRRRGKETEVPEAFVANFLGRVRALYPSKAYVRDSFKWEETPTLFPLPTVLALDIEESEAVKDEKLLTAALKKDVNRYWRDRKREEIDAFCESIALQMRQTAWDVIASTEESIKRNNGQIPAKTLGGLQTMIETVRTMDPSGDEELETALRAIEVQLKRDAESRDMGDLVTKVQDLGTVLRASLTLLGADRGMDGRAAFAVPSIEAVGAARERLGIAEIAPSPIMERAVVQRVKRSI